MSGHESLSKSDLAPIAVIAYRRPNHLRQCLQALTTNSEILKSRVTVYVDGPRREDEAEIVLEVARVAETCRGIPDLSVVVRPTNLGLGASVIDAVDDQLKASRSVIVLEDDLIVAQHFLKFMNDGISTYSTESTVASIHGYVYPVGSNLPPSFFLRGADCLGWATWRSAWSHLERDGEALIHRMSRLTSEERAVFDFGGRYPYLRMLEAQAEGRIDSWAIRWYASAFLANLHTLYPGESLVTHSGGDGSGTNVGITTAFDVVMALDPIDVARIPVVDSVEGRRAFEEYFERIRQKNASRTSLGFGGRILPRLLQKLRTRPRLGVVSTFRNWSRSLRSKP